MVAEESLLDKKRFHLDFLNFEGSAFDALLNSAHDLSLLSMLLLFVYLFNPSEMFQR